MRTEITIEVTDAWLNGATEAVAVPLEVLRGSPRFLLVPGDEKDRERVAAAHGYCIKCEGRGWDPVPWGKDMRSVPCPKCKGKTTTMADFDVRHAILQHFCKGWDGWTTREGRSIAYSPVVVESIARNAADIYGAIVNASQELKKAYSEVEQGNSESGPHTPSGEATHPSTDSPASGEL